LNAQGGGAFVGREVTVMKALAEMHADELLGEGKKRLISGDFAGSIDAFTLALEGGVSPVKALLGRGVALLKSGNYDGAVDDFTTLLKYEPEHWRAFQYRGTAYQLRGDHEKAVDDFTRVLRIHPDHGVAFFMRGMAFESLGMDEEAGRDIQTALRMSEHEIQQFVDSMGIVRTKTDKWWAEQIGERRVAPVSLDEDQARKLEGWFDETPCSRAECR